MNEESHDCHNKKWFFGQISRETSEAILSIGRRFGNVLVRISNRISGHYVISARTENQGITEIRHFEVVKSQNEGIKNAKFFIKLKGEHPTHDKLEQVLQYFVSFNSNLIPMNINREDLGLEDNNLSVILKQISYALANNARETLNDEKKESLSSNYDKNVITPENNADKMDDRKDDVKNKVLELEESFLCRNYFKGHKYDMFPSPKKLGEESDSGHSSDFNVVCNSQVVSHVGCERVEELTNKIEYNANLEMEMILKKVEKRESFSSTTITPSDANSKTNSEKENKSLKKNQETLLDELSNLLEIRRKIVEESIANAIKA